MKIPFVKRIKNNLKTLSVENFCKIVKSSVNADIDENGTIRCFSLNKYLSTAPTDWLLNVCKINDIIFYVANNGTVYYQVNKGGCGNVPATFTTEPEIILLKNEENGILIANGVGDGYLLKDGGVITQVALPVGGAMCYYNQRLFIANGRKLLFSAVDDYTNFTMDLNSGGMIQTSAEDGDILRLVENDGKLVIFTNKAVYEFTTDGERLDYKLERKIEFAFNNFFTKSVKVCDGKVVFINDNKLCTYKEGKIKEIDSYLDLDDVTVKNSFGVSGSAYYIALIENRYGGRILRYDFNGDRQCFIQTDYSLVCDGGMVSNNAGSIYTISQAEDSNCIVKFSSIDFDMGTAKDKVIHKISAFCQGECILTVQSDCGNYDFILESGANLKRMNLPSSTYSFNFSGNNGFSVYRLKIEYRVKED